MAGLQPADQIVEISGGFSSLDDRGISVSLVWLIPSTDQSLSPWERAPDFVIRFFPLQHAAPAVRRARARAFPGSPVTNRASGQLERPSNIVLLDKLASLPGLIRWRFPCHVVNLVARPDELFGIAMAFQTPIHLHGCDLIDQRHQVNAPVTGRTAHAFLHVDAVVEINIIGKVVDALPEDWFVIAPAFTDDGQIGAVGEELRMAIHAGLGRGDACEHGGPSVLF